MEKTPANDVAQRDLKQREIARRQDLLRDVEALIRAGSVDARKLVQLKQRAARVGLDLSGEPDTSAGSNELPTQHAPRMDSVRRLIQAAMKDGCDSVKEVRQWLKRKVGETVDGIEIDDIEDGWMHGCDHTRNGKFFKFSLNERGPLKDRVYREKHASR